MKTLMGSSENTRTEELGLVLAVQNRIEGRVPADSVHNLALSTKNKQGNPKSDHKISGKSCQAPGDRFDLGKALAYRQTGCHLRALIGPNSCELVTWHSPDDVDTLLLL